MKREPLALYLLRILTSFGLFAFMAMLYWSSSLVEEDLKSVRMELRQLRNDVRQLSFRTVFKRSAPAIRSSLGTIDDSHTHMNSDLPNLLSDDLFYEKTLPSLLPEEFEPVGTRKTASIGKPDNLHPFTNFSEALGWVSQCGVQLVRLKFGKYETMAPDMAVKIEERKRGSVGVPEFWIFLRDGVYWHPLTESMFGGKVKLAPLFLEKHQVTAHDFKFWFDAMMNPYLQEPGAVAMRNYLGEIEEIEVIDPLTFVVRWTPKKVNGRMRIKYVAKQMTGGLRALASHIYKRFPDGSKIIEDDSDPETYRTNSVWAQNFKEHWAKNIIPSCGAWIFEGISDRQISFRRNPDHYQPLDVLVQRSEVVFRNSPDSIWQDFQMGNVDSHDLRPDQLIELENFLKSDLYQEQERKGNGIGKLEYPARNYVYLGWNQATPFFKSRKIRQAMTLALDRERIINQYLNGMGIEITGPFAHDSAAYDQSIKPWPYDPQFARELLEEEGWYDSDGDGVIDKEIEGKRVPFAFSLTYFVKNPTTKSIVEYVATALNELGILVKLNGVDLADLSAAIDGKSLEAICMGWGLGTPPENPRQLWYSSGAKEPGSSNFIGFSNKEADQIIDALDFEEDPETRIKLYHRFHAIIHEEQPYTFLYAPKTLYLYRNYLKNVFIPADRQDLVPGADIAQPDGSVIWIEKRG
ncbi:ABC transporter substrate-binding protein [Waddlia chondrophila]|uniref:ABC-type dipeptide transport system, substrate-binding protein n=2 Tax=Waddlia chondrophila TaxID=71667 RepID=D6YU48_WADCW|nr:ABC transporter substrate-binding protein [Waddlia chondrophila]ADI37659.1 ABC-type dipeptide transport system, substrate- binding protein [Waddlia chondrophila WSU 86-1044]